MEADVLSDEAEVSGRKADESGAKADEKQRKAEQKQRKCGENEGFDVWVSRRGRGLRQVVLYSLGVCYWRFLRPPVHVLHKNSSALKNEFLGGSNSSGRG